MIKDYDAIVVGGVQNGLTTAAYLVQTDGFDSWVFAEIVTFSCELHQEVVGETGKSAVKKPVEY